MSAALASLLALSITGTVAGPVHAAPLLPLEGVLAPPPPPPPPPPQVSIPDQGRIEGVAIVPGGVQPGGQNASGSGAATRQGAPAPAVVVIDETAPLFSRRITWTREQWWDFVKSIPECAPYGLGNMPAQCQYNPADPTSAEPGLPSRAVTEAMAREVVVTLQLPDAAPHIGPDPSVNEWKMAVVGYPLWLWTEGPRALSATRSAHGITFTLQATLASTTFTMGDGATVTCPTTLPYPASTKPGTPSPACGYAYPKGRADRGTYTVTATTHWDVAWSALGYSGTLPARMSASRDLVVGELQAVVTR